MGRSPSGKGQIARQDCACKFDPTAPNGCWSRPLRNRGCPMSVNAIARSFQPLYGQPCWGLHYDRTLNLSMNFGKPALRIREPFNTDSKSEALRRMAARRLVTVRGEWWLWIYCCYWQLVSNGLQL